MSLSSSFSDRNERRGESLTGTVKRIDRAGDPKQRKVRVRFEGSRAEASVYVPEKYAKQLKPEHKYNFHLEEVPFRGGGQSRSLGSSIIRRTRGEPEEVRDRFR